MITRCIICSQSFESKSTRYKVCPNKKCKDIRHKQTTNEMIRLKAISRDISRAKKLLETHGYIIMPKISNCRIVIEPIG